MYEISLVPDIKSELLKQQKLRNLIILICLIVAGACVGILVILVGIMGTQKLRISGAKKEIICRYSGEADGCSNTGTPILKFKNAEDLLTIQKQMESVGSLNDEKVKLSRIFGVLDVVLPNNENDQMSLSELSVDLLNWTIYFNATAHSDNNVHSRAVQSFKKGIELSYYDYGHYMRPSSDGGENEEGEEIPAYCVDEKVVGGYVFGIYHKGMPGCEEEVVMEDGKIVEDKDKEKSDDEGDESSENDEENAENGTAVGTATEGEKSESYDALEELKARIGDGATLYEQGNKQYKVTDIYIRRTYKNQVDMTKYRSSSTDKVQKELNLADSPKGYYFKSECLQYNDDEAQTIDEDDTLEACPVLADSLVLGEPSVGRDSDGVLRQSIEANVPLSREIFLAKNAHMRIKGPSRQNVTDSYIQIRNMFSEELVQTGGEE